jgi:hypothetical protein
MRDNILDDLQMAVQKLTFWRDGNGSPGAEKRLQSATVLSEKAMEKACHASDQSTAAHVRIDKHETLHKEQRTLAIAIGIALVANIIIPIVLHFI